MRKRLNAVTWIADKSLCNQAMVNSYFLKWLQKAIKLEPNETPEHNYSKVCIADLDYLYVNGAKLNGRVQNVVSEPYYRDYITLPEDPLYPFKRKKADIAFEHSGKQYLVELVYSNRKIEEKIEMAQFYGLNLIVINMYAFYSNPEVKALGDNGEEYKKLCLFDAFFRSVMMKENNMQLVEFFN